MDVVTATAAVANTTDGATLQWHIQDSARGNNGSEADDDYDDDDDDDVEGRTR